MSEWLNKTAAPILGGLLFVLFFPVQLTSANPGAIYAATNNGVFKSTDRGANWTVANLGLAGRDVVSLDGRSGREISMSERHRLLVH